ncbi:MAG TPA: endonuclease III [bacterium]|nr:endonuclease III [bacterium]HOL66272.1 endonuclease III [bacterium]
MGKVQSIIRLLEKVYPESKTALSFSNPFQLLVATILSAQTTDEQVNRITPSLFRKFPGPEDFSRATEEEIIREIRSVNFYRTKAKNIRRLAELLCRNFHGQVPARMSDLIKLPGVARKTANVVLSQAFGKAEGIVVDTHVGRLARRLGLTEEEDPVKVEKDLMRLVPKAKWTTFPFLLMSHGRKICRARKPLCQQCLLKKLCPCPEKK